MKVLAIGCLLWTFFSTVASIKCSTCISLMGPCDDPEFEDCPGDEQACVNIVAHLDMLGGFDVNFKTCASPALCRAGTYTGTTEQNKHSVTKVTCCNTDYCNNEIITLPEEMDMTHNGLGCPACFSMGSEECDPDETAECIGEETKCITLAGDFDLGDPVFPLKTNAIFKGCTTPNSCIPEDSEALHYSHKGISYNITHIECSDATSISDTTPSPSDK